MKIYLNLLALSLAASASIGFLLILRRISRKRYSSRWLCIAWLVLCVRMLCPIQLVPSNLLVSRLDTVSSNPSATELENAASELGESGQVSTNSKYNVQSNDKEFGGNQTDDFKSIEDNEVYDNQSDDFETDDNQIDYLRADDNITDETKMNKSEADSQQIASDTTSLKVTDSESSSSQRKNSLFQLESIKDKIQLQIIGHVLNITYLIWLTGVILLCMQQIISYSAFRKIVEKVSRKAHSETYKELIREIALDCHIKKEISCYCCKEIKTPMFVGLFHPKILLPQIEYETQEIEAILKHELTHYQHRDTWKKVLIQSVKIIYWFCPMVYPMSKYATQDMELYCDETVIQNKDLSYRKSYSMAILKTITEGQNCNHDVLTACLSNGKKETKHRILCILGEGKTKKGTPNLTISFFIIFLLCNVCLSPMKRVMSQVNSSTNANEIVTNHVVEGLESEVGLSASLEKGNEEAEIIKDSLTSVRQMQQIVVLGLTNVKGGAIENECPDSIILVSLDWEKQQLILTSISRHLSVMDESGRSTKLMNLYKENQQEFYTQLQSVLGIALDGVISIDMEEFETVVDALGGVEITLTKEEREYLNQTNFISKKENRHVTEGTQTLNGNQALGYARIRMVPSSNGISGEWGRDDRQNQIIMTLYQEIKIQTSTQQLLLLTELMDEIKTTMELSELRCLIEAMIEVEWKLDSESFPAEGDWTQRNDSNQIMLEVTGQKQYLFQTIE